ASEENYAAWKTARDALLTGGCCPSMSVRTVTSLARAAAAEFSATETMGPRPASQAEAGPEVVLEKVERGEGERPYGRRFGALVHALLASIDLDAGTEEIKAGAVTDGRLVDATADEVEAAVATVAAVLAHPILR